MKTYYKHPDNFLQERGHENMERNGRIQCTNELFSARTLCLRFIGFNTLQEELVAFEFYFLNDLQENCSL